ncbi:MAG: hypothetical protein JNK11_08900 [Alphaproteobacteria bacterium]|nr:hypothetical protein [Alphaproteobacteria bacterium]
MAAAPPGWLGAYRRYLTAAAAGHLAWETLQLPLYTIWAEAPMPRLAWAVLHCTAGDIAIATASLSLALALLASPQWPAFRYRRVATAAIAIGVAYTVYSEWLNTTVRKDWAYAAAMPVLGPLGTGLAPLLQWVVVPAVAFLAAKPRNV